MFDNSVSPKQFLKALNDLEAATVKSTPKALHNGIKRLRQRAESFDGSNFRDFVRYISDPPTKSNTARKATAKKRGPSGALTREFIGKLERAEKDQDAFKKVIESYSKTCTALAFRNVAAEYAASSVPTSKDAAIDLMLGERANRIRTRRKISESGNATPW